MVYTKVFTLAAVTLLLVGCIDEFADELIGGGKNSSSPQDTFLSGSVGDGPVVGARIACFDAAGKKVCDTTSDSNARHSIKLAAGTAYPITIEASGGTDVVTARQPDYILRSVVVSPNDTTININPYTTLILRTAELLPGEITRNNVQTARDSVLDQFHFGITSDNFSDPVTSDINESNVAGVIKATEVLGELLRRTEQQLVASGKSTNIESVIDAIAADLVDGILDGRGKEGASSRIAVTVGVTGAQLAFELLSNAIYVNGADVIDALDTAIRTSEPNIVGSELIKGVPLSGATIRHASAMVRLAAQFSSSPALYAIGDTIDKIPAGVSSFDSEITLLNNDRSDFDNVISMLRDATPDQISAATIYARAQKSRRPLRGIFGLLRERTRENQRWLFSGGQVLVQWKDIEISDGIFDFSLLDQMLADIAEAKLTVTIQVNGNDHPDYLFEQIPYHPARMHNQVTDSLGTLMYWHPRYLQVHRRMLSRLAEHIRSSPYRQFILGVRQNYNAIGTEQRTLSPEYIDLSQWIIPPGVMPAGEWNRREAQLYSQEVLQWYSEYFAPDILVFARSTTFAKSSVFLSSPDNPDYDADQRLQASFLEKLNTGSWGLMRTSSEMEPRGILHEQDDVNFMEYCRSGRTVCYTEPWKDSRTPADDSQQNPLPASAPQRNYWRILNDLHIGSTYVAIYRQDWNLYQDGEYYAAFDFAARYAGYQAEPALADGAWVALREGNYLKGDYNLLMRRLDLDASVGLNNVGPADQRYGYWARSLPAGDVMSFEIDERFVDSVAASSITIRATYLDDNGSSFTISTGGREQTITGTGSGRWKTAELLVAGDNITVDNNGAHVRVSTETGVILHMMEVRRSSGE